jgi:hypothetical protein
MRLPEFHGDLCFGDGPGGCGRGQGCPGFVAVTAILTGEEVLERVKKLKTETPLQLGWMQ